MRVLLYSELCNPQMASEPGLIFRHIRAIVDAVDEAVVVTQIRNKDAISATGLGKAEVVYIDTEKAMRRSSMIMNALKLGPSAGFVVRYPSFLLFERMLWKHFRNDLDGGRFDIIHRLGPISAAIPSPLASWSRTPFVIGPVNGGLPYPKGFRDVLLNEGQWLRLVRGAYRLMPYATSTFRKAAAIQAAFDHTVTHLPPGVVDSVINVPENGADPQLFTAPPRDPGKKRIDVLFVGRLVPFKCADVLVTAFASSEKLRKHRLLIVGDGPERDRLEAIVRSRNLADSVILCGQKSQEEVAQMMQGADIFAFPSIRDSGAGVIVEAMMSGLASVAVDYGPSHSLINETTGVRVPLGTREDHVTRFTKAIEQLIDAPDLRVAMGQAAREFAERRLSWDAHARKTVEIYKWVLGRMKEKPVGLLEADI